MLGTDFNTASTVQKLALTLGLTSILTIWASRNEVNNMNHVDLWISCFFLTSWVVFFLPGLMDRLNISLIKDLFIIFFKLWTVDLAFSGFSKLRDLGNGIMDEDWFYKSTGFLRAAVVVSCIVVSTITYITKQIQRQRQKRLLLSRLRDKKIK